MESSPLSRPLHSYQNPAWIQHLGRLTAVLAVLALLGGCGPDPRPSTRQSTPAAKAQGLAASGNYTAAAQQYQRLAATAQGGTATDYRIQAGHYFALAGDEAQARTAMAGIDPRTLTPPRDQAYTVLQAHLELLQGRPREARDQLSRVSSLPPWSVPWLWQLRADAAAASGDAIGSLRARVMLDTRLDAGARKQANEDALWRTLQGLPGSQLDDLRPPRAGPALAGWAALARSYRNAPRQAGDPTAGLRQALAAWQARYPQHPAAQGFTARLLEQSSQLRLAPSTIGILLPTSGAVAGPAAAVRDGILAAWYQSPAQSRPTLRFYSVPQAADQVAQVYSEAIADGANLIIGPLRRGVVEALVASGGIQVPTLALNRISATDGLPYKLYQFGLPPEDEAIAAAREAARQGYTQALILAPVGERGDRVSNAFATAVIDNGGVLLEEQRYDNTQVSAFNNPIKRLLNIDVAEARHKAMERKLGKESRFNVVRRPDADYIFVYAYPRDARQIVPQLAFYDAGNLPTFTTSHAFDGRPDRDLRGIRFVTTPWQSTATGALLDARQLLQQAQPGRFDSYDRLYALGIDAYRLSSELPRLRSFSGATLPGATGELSVDPAGWVHRQPLWARVERGQVTLTADLIDGPAANPTGDLEANPGSNPADAGGPTTAGPAPDEGTVSGNPAVIATPLALPTSIQGSAIPSPVTPSPATPPSP